MNPHQTPQFRQMLGIVNDTLVQIQPLTEVPGEFHLVDSGDMLQLYAGSKPVMGARYFGKTIHPTTGEYCGPGKVRCVFLGQSLDFTIPKTT